MVLDINPGLLVIVEGLEYAGSQGPGSGLSRSGSAVSILLGLNSSLHSFPNICSLIIMKSKILRSATNVIKIISDGPN